MTFRKRDRIYLTKSLKVFVPSEFSADCDNEDRGSAVEVATIAKNFESVGFGLRPAVIRRLIRLPHSELSTWYREIARILESMVGAHRKFDPMYPNFPRQVMEASDAELYFNAVCHYLGFELSDMMDDPDLVVLPNYVKEARPELDEFQNLRWIELGDEEDFGKIFTRIVASNGSVSESDQEILRWYVENVDIAPLMPAVIPQKETLAFLVSIVSAPEMLRPAIKTATDVLRVAVAMSDGDVSLAAPTKFRSFSKPERRFLLQCLEDAGNSRTEDMLRWKNRWIRLAERLHPGDFKRRYPESVKSFDVLRNDLPFTTFQRRLEDAIAEGHSETTVKLLAKRPGDFARRLDHVLRTHDNPELIQQAFSEVSDQVSTPVLLQLWNHFLGRDKDIPSRSFFPKGNAAKVQLSEKPLVALPSGLAQSVSGRVRKTLVDRFAKLPPLGKVFIDKRLEQQIVPFSQRSASRSLRSISRGSSFSLPAGDTVRFFCWWKNIGKDSELKSRVDLDLSATLYKADWELSAEVAYYNLREDQCYHSGDITSAPKGACEFIDISLSSALKMGARYVVMSVLSFTGQPFISLPECFGGWMMRSKPRSGEIFEPKTVVDKIDITASSRACVPVIIDAKTRRMYWADLALRSAGQLVNAAGNSVGFSQIGRSIVELQKPTLFQLFQMHADARGTIVNDLSDADFVFGLNSGNVTAFDTNQILSDFLPT